MKRLPASILLSLSLVMTACKKAVVLHPSGDVAVQQRDILLFSTGLMLLIIVPVMVATAAFAWHYRQSNKAAKYEPDWDHSAKLELLIWSAPLLIVICLGAITWSSTHLLDPYRGLGRIDASHQVEAAGSPLEIDVVALDWKWLFIYPAQGVAAVNELAVPVDRPVAFHITSATVMNSFYIPAMAGQIYAMPGMETRLSAVMNRPGDYEGFSANYSGAGFSKMRFKLHATDAAGFDAWIADTKKGSGELDRDAYISLAKPSEAEPARMFGTVDGDLFGKILNLCVEPGKMCLHQMAMIDAKGGLGLAGIYNVLPLTYDRQVLRTAFGPLRTYVPAICDPSHKDAKADIFAHQPQIVDASPLLGEGLPLPFNGHAP